MNLQPTIFLSSIITEFYDLRGALRYFLGKSGFRVLMSEEPDFGADCGKDSLDNCKLQIEKSDYYLLIIGNNPGTIFQSEGKDTSVTFEEFKHYINLHKKGNTLNFIAFVRQQAWENYQNKDTSKIHPLQIAFIDMLLNDSLFQDKKIGRWRYTFDKFNDIISTLETNQNGLFIDATRKSSIYKTYVKREITDIYKSMLEKDDKTGDIQSLIDFTKLENITHLDYINPTLIDKEIAVRISVFLMFTSKKTPLLRKVNRVFNYIAQGEFSKFDSQNEKYVLPEYIKLSIQTLEILEGIFEFINNNEDLFSEIRKRPSSRFFINKMEYNLIKSTYDRLNTAFAKLSNLIRFFHEDWTDLASKEDSFYEYRGGIGQTISNEDALKYANQYFGK